MLWTQQLSENPYRIRAVEEGGQDGEVGGEDVRAGLQQRLRAREVARPRLLRVRRASIRDLRSVWPSIREALWLCRSISV